MAVVPKNSVVAYELFYRIEVGLREFMISEFGRGDQHWWKIRIPQDILEKLRQGREIERKTKWTELIPHHPLYYVDFPDLRKIIEIKDNWQGAFQELLGDKDVYCGGLRELEPIRNKIAHNRKISDGDIFLLRANDAKLENALGREEWLSLIASQTTAPNIYEELARLRACSANVYKSISHCQPVDNLVEWAELKTKWWFDDDYLCADLSGLRDFYDLVEQYVKLPRYRGSGHLIQDWVEHNLTPDCYRDIESRFAAWLDEKGL